MAMQMAMQNTEELTARLKKEENICAQSPVVTREAEEDQALMTKEAIEFRNERNLQLAMVQSQMTRKEEELQQPEQGVGKCSPGGPSHVGQPLGVSRRGDANHVG